MSVEGLATESGPAVPERDSLIGGGTGEQVAVRFEFNIVDTIHVSSEGAPSLVHVHVDQLYAMVQTPADDVVLLVVPVQTPNCTLVFTIRHLAVRIHEVPHLYIHISSKI